MKSCLVDIPDDPSDWPHWLDRQLVGCELGHLVDELRLVVPTNETQSSPSLATLCGDQMMGILMAGCSALSDSQLRSLLRNPELLLELQERVFTEGGDYWQSVPRTEEHLTLAKAQWSNVSELLDQVPSPTPAKEKAEPKVVSRRLVHYVMALAAVLVVGVGTWYTLSQQSTPAGWGFDRAGLLTADMTPRQYFDQLADAAGDWFNKRPETREALALRLQEFSDGCQTLIDAEHPQLSKEDRTWLVDRCRSWKGKIDGYVADLSAGESSAIRVREKADDTVRQLMETLQTRDATG